jgi:hypothetical protein
MKDSDCIIAGLAALGQSRCEVSSGFCLGGCATDEDCGANPLGPHCVQVDAGPICGCGTDADCAGNPSGPHCDTSSADALDGACACYATTECAAGLACQLRPGSTSAQCGGGCARDSDCATGFLCDPRAICRPRCDLGYACHDPQDICDITNLAGQNQPPRSGGATWCYQCLSPTDCPPGKGCISGVFTCGACTDNTDCRAGEACISGVCQASCSDAGCGSGEVCDALGLAGLGADVCLGCRGPFDCPIGKGCESATHSCGHCNGPTAFGGPYDCAPGDICSDYWTEKEAGLTAQGVCLQGCDNQPCPAGKTCETFPSITPFHKYCFGCLQDSDCDGGWCDSSVNATFTCQPSPQ